MQSALNQHAINSSAASVVVGVLASVGLAVSVNAQAYVTAGGFGNVTSSLTVDSMVANQIHDGRSKNAVVNNSASHFAERWVLAQVHLDSPNLATSHSSFLYAAGVGQTGVVISAENNPHYLLVPTVLGESALNLDSDLIGYPTKRGLGRTAKIELTGYHFIPKLVQVRDMYSVVSFSGYCIPANELGYGETVPFTAGTASHNAVVLRNAKMSASFGIATEPLSGTYNTALGFSVAETNIRTFTNIKVNEIWYWEQQTQLLNIAAPHNAFVSRIVPQQATTGLSASHQAVAIRNGIGRQQLTSLGFYHGTQRTAAPFMRAALSLYTTGMGDRRTPQGSTLSVSLTPSHNYNVIRFGVGNSSLAMQAASSALRYSRQVNSVSDAAITTQAIGVKVRLGYGTSFVELANTNKALRTANAFTATSLTATVSHSAIVMTTMQLSKFESRANGNGTRVLRGLGNNILLGFLPTHSPRLAIRHEANATLYRLSFGGFPVVNPYSTAPAERQLGAIPFDDRSMVVPTDNREMVIA